jgi:hypothetical protein
LFTIKTSQKELWLKQNQGGKMTLNLENGGNLSAKSTDQGEGGKIKTICLMCGCTFETEDPESFLMPGHKISHSKFNAICGASKRDFTYSGKPLKKPPPQIADDLPPIAVFPQKTRSDKQRRV